MKKYILPLFYVAFAVGRICASSPEIHPAAGTTSASFLKIGAGARASGLAGAFSGISDDATAVYWNPAGLALVERNQLNASHNESFEGIRHDFLGAATRRKNLALGAAFYGLYTPNDIERRSGVNEDDPFEPVTPVEGYFAAYDAALSVGAARFFRKDLALGGAFKIISQSIDDAVGWGAAIDAGAMYFYKPSLTFAAVVQHLGTPIKIGRTAYPLPLTFRAAVSHLKKFSGGGALRSSFETSFPIDNFPTFHAGAEYLPSKTFALRAGYRYRAYGLELGDISGLAVGAGVKFPVGSSDIGIDYAFNPYGVLGNSHRLSIICAFGPILTAARADGSDVRRPEPPARRAAPAVLPPPPRAPAPRPADADYARARAVFEPKIVAPAASVGKISVFPARQEIKSLTASFAARGAPDVDFAIARRDSPDGKSAELFFKTPAAGRISDVNIVVESEKKISAVSAIPDHRSVAFAPVAVTAAPAGKYIYEIKTPKLCDIILIFVE